eukprot:Nitzschia sp. Nitz4//scaffold322_size40381//10752//11178//NITZ4_007556-RA/size40381-snap-gene-0.1-mRNA-1//1//CDS//3329547815//9073//frame0
MSLAASRAVATRALARRATLQQQQQRGIVDYLTNYPNKVAEMRKVQCEGGTKLGEANPTWLKQPQDKAVAGFGFALTAFGLVNIGVGFFRLATGKGKLDD